MNKKLGKKGVLQDLEALAVGLVSVAIVLVVVFLIMAQLSANTQVLADSNATAAVGKTQVATDQIPDWLSIIVIVFIGGIILGLIALFRRGSSR